MTQQVEEEDPASATGTKQSTVHFLRDVVFHGKFELLKAVTPDESTCYQKGLYFEDGQRRVDYILTYNLKKPLGSRISRYVPHMPTENAFTHGRRSKDKNQLQPQRPGLKSSTAGLGGELGSPGEDDRILQREDFESKLRDMGLELEKEENGKIPGVGFVKIHAPWNVLCREAEFMKLKMPTKKCYEVKQSSGFVEKLMSLASKVVEPLHPHVEDHHSKNVKHLSHTFSREKQHLFDLSDKDCFFDSKTRSSIVYEILKRTKCRAKYSIGITSLLGRGVYTAAYPLHDGDTEEYAEPNDRKLLYEEWANYSVFYKYQPIGLVRYTQSKPLPPC